MIELGKMQMLEVVRKDQKGLYLNSKKAKDKNDAFKKSKGQK